jgi:hypothetical protein
MVEWEERGLMQGRIDDWVDQERQGSDCRNMVERTRQGSGSQHMAEHVGSEEGFEPSCAAESVEEHSERRNMSEVVV